VMDAQVGLAIASPQPAVAGPTPTVPLTPKPRGRANGSTGRTRPQAPGRSRLPPKSARGAHLEWRPFAWRSASYMA
jgi:hypothetical protein